MQKISDKARAHTAALLAYIEQATPTRDDLETWWLQRHPVRLELHRLCRDLVADDRLVQDGNTWRVTAKAVLPRHASPTAVLLANLPDGVRLRSVLAGTPPQVTVEMGHGGDAVIIIGAPARVVAMADAYRRQVAAEAEAARKDPATPPTRDKTDAAPAEPGPKSNHGRVLAALRRKPGTLPQLRARLPAMNHNTLRGALGALKGNGLARLTGDVWEAVS